MTRLVFVEIRTGDWEVPVVNWIVEATPEQQKEIEEALTHLHPDEQADPYVGATEPLSVPEFLAQLKEWLPDDEEDEDDD
jgi:hypothetical protein